ncbi:hypothetical protein QPK32_17575 [Massilia sp. YIM B02763]|uniref:hypothetical protein n=1 Tax=Massilia sp. YIM B02763 TaxID=3050130 RepID=UPI0025B63920|nr:hypothetical protein [Massilia sp. YIM B02763]MDN4054893.1 hypothetical protein [Massilia sp. YIM B02763]
MKHVFVLAGALALTPPTLLASDSTLYDLSVKDVPVENGKLLDMDFREIERRTDSSIVQIIRRSGGSVSSSMFVLRGMCGLARSRHAQYFIPRRIPDEKIERYLVTFPSDEPEPGKGFTMTQCDLMRY